MATDTRAPTSDFATGGTVAYSSGTTGFNLTNDYPDTADPLTTYVTLGTTANSFIAFNFTAFAVPTGSVINSVQVRYTDEEPSNGVNSAAGRLRIGGTYYDAATHLPTTTTTSRTDTWTTNPRTAAAWLVADVNGSGANPLQNFGVIGPDSNPVWRLGSIQVLVDYTAPATGTISSTESGGDDATMAGLVLVKGSFAPSETGEDDATMAGTVADAVATGTLAATETGADDATMAGTVPVQGDVAATEGGGDVSALAGLVAVQGALAATETGADTATASGLVLVRGSVAADEAGADVASITGTVPGASVSGELAAVDAGSDVAAFAGTASQPEHPLHGRPVRRVRRGKVVRFEDELPPVVVELPKPAIRASIAGDVALVVRIDEARANLERFKARQAAAREQAELAAAQEAVDAIRQTLAALQAEYTAALDALELARQREAAIIARLRDEDDFMLLLAA